MKKKLFLIFTFLVAISAIFLFKSVSSAHAAGYISAQDPYPPLGGYSNANKVDISVTLVDSVTGNGIVGDVHLWSTYPTDSCGSSVQGTVDSTKTATGPNYNPDFPVSCAHGIWVEAKNSPGYYDFSPYCLQCASNTCYLYGHNGQYVFYKIHLDPIPVTPPASLPINLQHSGVPTACLNSGSKYGSGITLRWDASSDVTDYEVHFTKTQPLNGDFATKIVTTNSASSSGGWSANGNALVTWLSAASGNNLNLSLDPDVNYYWMVRARGPGGNSAFSSSDSFSVSTCANPAPIVPTPSAPSNVPACVNSGSTYGSGITLNWGTVANATGYTLRFTSIQKLNGDFATKAAGNVGSTTGTGGWTANGNPLVTWLSGSNLNLQPNVTYFYAISAQGAGGDSGFDLGNKSQQVGPVPLCVPAVPSNLVVTGSPTCVSRGSTYGTALNLSWDASANATSYTLRVTKDVKTGIDFGSKVSATTSATGTGSWSNNGNVAVTWVSSGNLAMVADTAYFFAVSATGSGGSSGYDLFNKSVQVGPVPLCNAADPSNLSVINSCDGANPQVQFTFTDNSINEDNFYLDVNLAQWGGDAAPSPWGYKIIAAHSGIGQVSYIWKVADPLIGGPPTVPVLATTYYWRVLAHRTLADGSLADSNHVYPLATLTPPGASFTTLTSATCQQVSDLKAEFVADSWQDHNHNPNPNRVYAPGEVAYVDIKITNLSATGNSPVTKLYFYPNGTDVDCAASPIVPATSVPKDYANVSQDYSVLSIGSGLTQTITVNFTVTGIVGGATAYATVVPVCNFAPASVIDPNYANNKAGGVSYTIGADGFFETQGGDVGVAVGKNIRTTFDSSTIATPRYQSDYIIAGTTGDNVHSKNGWMLDNYTQKQVNSTSVYDYFWNKFKDKATPVPCDFTGVVPIRHCVGSLTFGAADVAPVGSIVFFVDGDLVINKILSIAPTSSLVFIVKGNIIIAKSVQRVDGVYITKQSFVDSDVGDGSLDVFSKRLLVNGAIYADGTIDMRRYFSTGGANHLAAPVQVFYQPKYLVQMIDSLGVKAINWKEVAP